MPAEPEKPELSVEEIRKLRMHGRVIRYMKNEVGFRWSDIAREAKLFRDTKGGLVRVSASGVKNYMAQTRRIKRAYTEIAEKLIGKALYEELLALAYRDRPEWFSEPSAKQR